MYKKLFLKKEKEERWGGGGGACSMYGDKDIQGLVGKLERKRTLGRPRRR